MALGALLAVLCLVLTLVGGQPATLRNGTVFMKDGQATFQEGLVDKLHGAAYGLYNDTLLSTGWGVLEVATGRQAPGLTGRDLAYAAGYLEGVLTAKEVAANADNMQRFWSKGYLSKVKIQSSMNWLLKQDGWARGFAAENANHSSLARVTGYLLAQFDGLLAGVQATVGSNRFTKESLLMLVNTGDLIDLTSMFSDEKEEPDLDAMTPAERRQYVVLGGLCSALIKVTPGMENVLMSHVSWFTYSATMRIYKHYDLDLRDTEAMPNGRLSFSSYAGYLTSLDDFYLLASGLVVLQTTNGIFNKSLYTATSPAALVSWQRVRAANHMAVNGPMWGRILSQHNSGTYNNQYMVLDLSKVRLKQGLDDSALTVVEQIPGLVQWSDQTTILRTGYWASYNVPFHERVYNLSGYPDFVARYGPDFSYQLAPRAKLFRRDSGRVANLDDLKRLMRSNNYLHDPYSEGDPTSAICARGDLMPGSKARPSGCYDGKATEVAMARGLASEAISGPTTAEGTLPTFSWAQPAFKALPHVGLPETYTFNWTAMQPSLW